MTKVIILGEAQGAEPEKKFKLPKPFAEKWLAALRSGEYNQVSGQLTDCRGGYCCLGVAGKISGIPDEVLYTEVVLEEHFAHNIPIEIIGDTKWVEQTGNLLVANLVKLNDGTHDPEVNPKAEQLSFSEIADWVEKNVVFYD